MFQRLEKTYLKKGQKKPTPPSNLALRGPPFYKPEIIRYLTASETPLKNGWEVGRRKQPFLLVLGLKVTFQGSFSLLNFGRGGIHSYLKINWGVQSPPEKVGWKDFVSGKLAHL